MPVLELLEKAEAGVADIGYCSAGVDDTDHTRLVREARADRESRGFDIGGSFAFCGRCHMLVPLECRVG